jgi:hypothetical protein
MALQPGPETSMEVLKPIRQAKASPVLSVTPRDESDGELREIHFELYSLGRNELRDNYDPDRTRTDRYPGA